MYYYYYFCNDSRYNITDYKVFYSIIGSSINYAVHWYSNTSLKTQYR